MPIDASIPLRAITDRPSPMDKYAQRMQIKNALLQQRAYEDAQARETQKRNLLTQAYDPATGNMDYGSMEGALMQGGFADEALALRERRIKEQGLMHKQRREDLTLEAQLLGSATDQQTYDAARAKAQSIGIDTADWPQYFDPNVVSHAIRAGLSAKEQIDMAQTNATFEETKRHNRATEGNEALVEIYDPNSPTGTRMVRRRDAAGQPGRMPSGMDIQFGDDGRVIGISTGRKAGGNADISRRTQGDVEKKMIEAGGVLSQLTSIRARFKPEYQTYGMKLWTKWSGVKEKINPDNLSPSEKQIMEDYRQYASEAGQLFALTLKDLSGVAVNPTEFKRAEQWIPYPGTGIFNGDSPSEMSAKIHRFEIFSRKALAKAAYIKAHGLTINDVDVDDMPIMMNKRGNELEAELRSAGLSGDDLRTAVRQRLGDEFGLSAY